MIKRLILIMLAVPALLVGLAFGVLGPATASAVLVAVFDPVNTAIYVNGSAGTATSTTPSDANGVLTAIWDGVNTAIRVNCILGCGGPTVLITQYPAKAQGGSGSITLTQGSAVVQVSGTWTSQQIGTILTDTDTIPSFRSVVTAVGSGTITLASPYPAPTVTATTNWTSTGGDVCAQINVALILNPGGNIDATGVTGSHLTCSVNPFNLVVFQPGGSLRLGNGVYISGREWAVPTFFTMVGNGRSNWLAGLSSGTLIQVDPVPFATQNSGSGVGVATVTFSANSTAFADTAATFQVTATSSGCDGLFFAHLNLPGGLLGVVDGQTLTLTGFTPGAYNETAEIASVAGTYVEIYVPAGDCSDAAKVNGAVSVTAGAYLQASYVSTANTGTLTSAPTSPCLVGGNSAATCIVVTDTVAEFIATDAGSCTLTATTNFSTAGPFTVAEYIDSTHEAIMPTLNADPVWAASAFTKKCWVQSPVQSVTNATTLVTTNKLQSTLIGNATYTLAPPVVSIAPFGPSAGNFNVPFSSRMADFTIDCKQLLNCTGLQYFNAQEQNRMDNITISNYTTYGLELEAGHPGPLTNLEMGFSSGTNETPLGSCIGINTSVDLGVTRGVESVTCTVGGTIYPWAAVDIEGPRVTLRNIHMEGYVNGAVICRYQGTVCKSIILDGFEPGIYGYNGLLIPNASNTVGSNTGVKVEGMYMSNTPANVMIDDHLVGPQCGPGRTLMTGVLNELTDYTLGSLAVNQSTFRDRWTTSPTVDDCHGVANSSLGSSALVAQYFKAQTQVIQVAGANFTTTQTSPTLITGLTWTEPELSARTWSFSCDLAYSEVATLGVDVFSVQTATTAPTNLFAQGWMQIAAATAPLPVVPVVANSSTTAQTVLSGTPGVAATVYAAHMSGTFEGTSTTSPTVFNVMANVTGADGTLTVYRGSACTIW